ncbi:hypothetical protein ABZ484_35350 [Streptomyces sp. NPDC006393]|uniref:hypothetical protein n=1 Tax=Streptomyces sp. NPDC006393 TaxID=3156763 RepID=UPI0033E696EF
MRHVGGYAVERRLGEAGVTLQVDTVEADFAWSEISAVIRPPARRGRFTVTVRLHDGMSCPCELDARRADLRDAWIGRLHDLVSRYLGR